MDVLITPIGDQDPFSYKNQQPGSALTLAQALRPRLVYLLPTRLPAALDGTPLPGTETYGNALRTKEELERLDPQPVVEIIEMVVSKPNLFAQILPQMEHAAARIREECAIYNEPITMHVNAGSGTPAIKQAVMLLVSGGLLVGEQGHATVYVVDDPTRIEPGADRIQVIDVAVIEEVRLVPHIRELVAARQWALAQESLQRLAAISSYAERAAVAHTLGWTLGVFVLLDRLAYGKARDALRQLRTRKESRTGCERLPALAQLLDTYNPLLDLLAQGDRPSIIADLLCNAEHRLRRSEYADALARCWHIIETMLRSRLASHHQIDLDTQPVLSSPQYQVLGDMLMVDNSGRLRSQQYIGSMWEGICRLNDQVLVRLHNQSIPGDLSTTLSAALRAQHAAGGSLAAALDRNFRAQLRGQARQPAIKTWADVRAYLNDVRNHSVIAHGDNEVPEAAARAATALAGELARKLLPSSGAITDQDHLERFQACLEEGLRRPP